MSVARSPGRAEHNDAIGAYRAAMQLSPNKEVRTRRTAAFVPSPFSAEHISRDCIFVFTPSPHRCVRSPTQQLVCPPAGSGLLHGGNRSARRRSGPKLGRRVLPRNPHSTYRPKLFCVSWALTLSSGGRRPVHCRFEQGASGARAVVPGRRSHRGRPRTGAVFHSSHWPWRRRRERRAA